MKYRLRWERTALDELTSAWLAADAATRQAITVATHALEEQLRTNPTEQGESRSGGRRILHVPPLGITFRVDDQNYVVSVLHVWCFRSRRT